MSDAPATIIDKLRMYSALNNDQGICKAAIEHISTQAARIAELDRPDCHYKKIDDDHMPGTLQSTCGIYYTLNETDDPLPNYCGNCGGAIKETT